MLQSSEHKNYNELSSIVSIALPVSKQQSEKDDALEYNLRFEVT